MLEEQFNNFIKEFDLNDNNIKLKYDHSLRVMKKQVKYAKLLNYSEEDIEIARLIGLLHDYGRFGQYKIYHSYDDVNTIDHADYSVEQLFDNNEIENYTLNKKWYPIIRFAIKNHNKKVIESCKNKKMIMHAKLIRDTDKLDIIHIFTKYKKYKEKTSNEPISPRVLKAIRNHQLVDKKDRKNPNDHVVTKFAFVFDINNEIFLKDLKKELKKYYKELNNPVFDESFQIIMDYINERIKQNERTRKKV